MRRAKVFLSLVGFLLGATGVALDYRPLVWAAMAVLVAALALRLWLKRDERRSRGAEESSGH
jgi:Flp pilus assembly protein TadB